MPSAPANTFGGDHGPAGLGAVVTNDTGRLSTMLVATM